MTREEAKNWFLDHMPMKIIMSTAYDAYSAALTALRPVSREWVEKVWRGEWISTGAISCKCSKCNKLKLKSSADEYNFCPHCMAAMTDEAVEMVFERLKEVISE